MGDVFKMSQKERKSLVEFTLVRKDQVSLIEAALRLGRSYRQARRMYKRFRQEGEKGLIHRSRERPSNRRYPQAMRADCLEKYKERMAGFGPTFAAEKFAELGIAINHETLRGWLMGAGLWTRARKRGPHRNWREPKHHFGEMVQMDGSFHDWFGDGTKCCLMNMVDDATNVTYAQFYKEETTAAAMEMLWAWIEKYGVPRSLYTDRKTVYVTGREATMEEELAGEEPLTAFGKACQKLGVRIIEAHSPQAKGRVERKNGVYQDRLIKDMSFHAIRGMEAGNQWLRERFVGEMNQKFGHPAKSDLDLHQSLPKEVKLKDVFVWEESREVQRDGLIRWQNRWFQLFGEKRPPAKKDVEVQERLDGSVRIVYRGIEQQYKEIQKPGKKEKEKLPVKTELTRKPAPDHPWRKTGFLSRKNRKPAASAVPIGS